MSDPTGLVPPPVDRDSLRQALDCLREGFQIIGYDWRYIYVNPAAASHGRRAAGELIGKPMTEAYSGIDRTPMFTVLRRCMEERTSHVLENEFTFPDGTTRWFEIRVQPVPEGICIYSADIENRKRRQLARDGNPAARSILQRIRNLFSA
jgi:hypothetical protein